MFNFLFIFINIAVKFQYNDNCDLFIFNISKLKNMDYMYYFNKCQSNKKQFNALSKRKHISLKDLKVETFNCIV